MLNTKEDIKPIMAELGINPFEIFHFEVKVNTDNLADIIKELGEHTAFRLSHDNPNLPHYNEYQTENYELTLEGDILKGKCIQVNVNNFKDLIHVD